MISVDHRHLYVAYIRGSKGEFTVAKDQYVRLHTGWFSDRSACYLAAGRPVITQQTGFTRFYGGNEGLVRLRKHRRHRPSGRRRSTRTTSGIRAAPPSDLAREFFEAETVLRSLLERIGM